jgi:hypothetical protein
VLSIRRKRTSQVVFAFPLAGVLPSRETVRTIAAIIVRIPTPNTPPRENFSTVGIFSLYKAWMGIAITTSGQRLPSVMIECAESTH